MSEFPMAPAHCNAGTITYEFGRDVPGGVARCELCPATAVYDGRAGTWGPWRLPGEAPVVTPPKPPCAHEKTLAIRCNRTKGVLPLRITIGPDEAERLAWCVDCGAIQIIRIQMRASVTMREEVWVRPGDPRALAAVHATPSEPPPGGGS